MRGNLPPKRPVYADSSPLIGLARINQLDLLKVLPTPILLTEYMWNELAGKGVRPGVDRILEAQRAGLVVMVQDSDLYAEAPE